MDDELEKYVLEKLASERAQQAERDRLVVLEQLQDARPTIERQFEAVRSESANDPAETLKRVRDLSRHLSNLGGRRDAWFTLRSHYHRLEKQVDLSLKLEVAIELAEMMFADDMPDEASRLLHDLKAHAESLETREKFRFTRLLAMGYLQRCAYTDAQVALQRAAELAPDTVSREEQHALLDEARLLQGDFGSGPAVSSEGAQP